MSTGWEAATPRKPSYTQCTVEKKPASGRTRAGFLRVSDAGRYSVLVWT